MLVKRLHAAGVVQAQRRESRLLAQLAERRLLGTLAGLHGAVDGLPRAGVAAAGPAAQHQHLGAPRIAAQHVRVDEANARVDGRRTASAGGGRAPPRAAPTGRARGTAW